MELFLLLDNQTLIYRPGDIVTGNVNLKLEEALSARYVTVFIDGGADIRWTVGHSKDLRKLDGMTPRETRNIIHFANLPYISEESTVWGDGEDVQLEPGSYEFPFRFRLPFHCPPSFEGRYGYIRYQCRAEVEGTWGAKYEVGQNFTVIPNFVCESIPCHRFDPISTTLRENFGFSICRMGIIQITVSVPKRSFLPLESIPIRLTIKNTSKTDVRKIKIKLREHTTYYTSNCYVRWHPDEVFQGVTEEENFRSHKRTVARVEEPFPVPAECTSFRMIYLQVPFVVPSFKTSPAMIQLEYRIEAKYFTNAILHRSTTKAEIPIEIGTLPILNYSNRF